MLCTSKPGPSSKPATLKPSPCSYRTGAMSYCNSRTNPFHIMFDIVHALLLVGTRFLRPPIFRRLSGGTAGESPTATCRDTRRLTGNYAAVYPPVHPLKPPGNFRAIARLISGTFRRRRAPKALGDQGCIWMLACRGGTAHLQSRFIQWTFIQRNTSIIHRQRRIECRIE